MSQPIETDLVRRIGKLSRVELTDAEVQTFAGQLGDILTYFDKLQQLDTENIAPLVHPVELSNVLAPDELGESLTPEQALANAPDRDGDFFKVPKVIGDSQ
ncbi:MAG: Asp-tRNA(Asn)/Glu-tRNA(Gln) amidotransferase subunit GatC [Phycisphaerae bacterium]